MASKLPPQMPGQEWWRRKYAAQDQTRAFLTQWVEGMRGYTVSIGWGLWKRGVMLRRRRIYRAYPLGESTQYRSRLTGVIFAAHIVLAWDSPRWLLNWGRQVGALRAPKGARFTLSLARACVMREKLRG